MIGSYGQSAASDRILYQSAAGRDEDSISFGKTAASQDRKSEGAMRRKREGRQRTAPQLNVRSGPGTAFGAVAALVKDDAMEVIGQSNNCAWLQVRTKNGVEGWVAHVVGGKEYALLNIPCDTVPEVVVPKPTPLPQPTNPPAVARVPVKQAILGPDEYADILPTTLCIMNAFEENETFSGYMCFAAAQPIGTSEITMLTYILRACPASGSCTSQGGGGQGENIALPASQALPADASLTRGKDGSFSLTATGDGFDLQILLQHGDPQLIASKLADLAARQFTKIRQGG